jgi:iron-sulfur cluster assembly protein
MLDLTETAATLVRHLVEESDLPSGAGLRIATDERHHSLSMALVTAEAVDDAVVTKQGAHLFLAPSVARRLTHRTLCAEMTGNRSLFFLNRN